MTERPSVSGALARAEAAHAKIDAHEDVCAERYKAINSTLGELKDGQKAHGRAAWGIVLALLAWMGAQLWAAQEQRVERLEVPHAAADR